MADVPRPGMPQDEKDRLGAELRDAEQRDAAADRGELVEDDQLQGLTKAQLLRQAELRGIEVRSSDTKAEILAALGVQTDTASGEPADDKSEEA